MAALGRIIGQLYRDFGKPLVDEVVSVLGRDAEPEMVAKAVAQRAKAAPPKPLALPAPGPGLPSYAAKPRGGQFWVDKDVYGSNVSPEAAARQSARALSAQRFVPDDDYEVIQIGPRPGGIQTTETDAQKWLERALTKDYKTEFGSPDDPLRDLAERGLHYDPDMTPEKWQATVNSYLMEDPVEHILFPPNPKGGMPGAGSNMRGEAMLAMPWLTKLPVTDKVYGISSGGLDLGHFTDEFLNVLNDAEGAGLPMDLAVRPESLNRMTFPQAVERVGRINQFRAKEMERAALSNLDSPAVRTFKEYPENNPMGLRWTELKAPELTDELPQGYRVEEDAARQPFGSGYAVFKDDKQIAGETDRDRALDFIRRGLLGDALKYEGDTMGHCVGGYCDDVAAGRSRIFSLRDAKGEPHVTIETSPITIQNAAAIDKEIGDLYSKYYNVADPDDASLDADFEKWVSTTAPDVYQRFVEQGPKERIVQIKGKQNRAPKDEYLPFVQDFVKSGRWGNVGDLDYTGLVKLPDGRYITRQQMKEGMDRARAELPEGYNPRTMLMFNWKGISPFFEGYAVGGRVSADRCFSRNPMSVNKARGGLSVKRKR
jgi:hypothetical protein